MDFVVHKVVQFQDVLVPNGDLTGEFLTCAAIIKVRLTRLVKARHQQMLVDVSLFRTIEDRGRDWNAVPHITRCFKKLILGHVFGRIGQNVSAVSAFHCSANRADVAIAAMLIQRFRDRPAQTGSSPPHMRLKDLPHVHARWHAQRVQNHVNRSAVFQEWHVFDRNHFGNHTLVAVTTGHFITWLQLALNRDEDLDHLHDARGQIIAAADLFDLVFEPSLKHALLRFVLLVQRFDLSLVFFFRQNDLPPETFGQRHVQHLIIDERAGRNAFRAFHSGLAVDQCAQTRIDVAVQNGLLVVAVTGEAFDFLAFDLHRTLVLVDAVTVEDANLNNRTEIARRHLQRGVANVRGFLTKDGAQKLFFRRHRAFTLWRDLADQNVARPNFGADIDNASLVEIS